MDESPDHEPTLIERGMGVHLNHLIAAQRGTRNSRPARWELRTPRSPSLGGKTRERIDKSESPPRSPRTGLGSGARRTATPPGTHRTQTMPNTCAWHRRGRLKYRRCWLKLTLRTRAEPAQKTLQERPRPCKASGARPAGPLARPHGIAPATRGRKSHQQASASAGSPRIHPQMLGGYCRGQP
jgi:hypothetical protein